MNTVAVVAIEENFEKKSSTVSSCNFLPATFFFSSSRPRSREHVSHWETVMNGSVRGRLDAVDTSSSFPFLLLSFFASSRGIDDVVHQPLHPCGLLAECGTNEASLEREKEKEDTEWASRSASENATHMFFFLENESESNDTLPNSSLPPTDVPDRPDRPRPPPRRNDGHFWIWGMAFGVGVVLLSVALLCFFLIRRHRRVKRTVESLDACNAMDEDEREEEMMEDTLEIKLYENMENEEREGKESCVAVRHPPSRPLRSSIFSSPGTEEERG